MGTEQYYDNEDLKILIKKEHLEGEAFYEQKEEATKRQKD